jgi:putative ABC transport system permease protein
VSDASAVLEEQLALAGRPEPLKLIAIDPFRAAAVQPMLIGPIRGDILTLLDADAVILSAAAAEQLQVRRGERFNVLVGSTSRALQVIAILPQGVYAEPLALMDLAAAQWTLGQLGRINRIDLRLRPGTAVQAYRTRLLARLPPGVLAVAPEVEMERAAGATRAYRVNLNMLALVTLLTGAFLVFSTQWLSVLRRRSQLALLRALGVTLPVRRRPWHRRRCGSTPVPERRSGHWPPRADTGFPGTSAPAGSVLRAGYDSQRARRVAPSAGGSKARTGPGIESG